MNSILRTALTCLTCTLLLVCSFNNVTGQTQCIPIITSQPDVTLACGTSCTSFSITVPDMKQTTDYTVQTIPFIPFAYHGGTELTALYDDDVFSGVINLPFTVCFYGQNYTQAIIGSNAVVTFDLAKANCDNTYGLAPAQPIPFATSPVCPAQEEKDYPKAAIFGGYHDIDPVIYDGDETGSSNADRRIEYRVEGSAPCRKLVVSYYHIGMYDGPINSVTHMPDSICTQQIVISEGTGNIDVFLENKRLVTTASNWQNRLGILGVQDFTRTLAVAAPGKNSTVWTANNEGYRFLPSGGTTRFVKSELMLGATVVATAVPTFINNTVKLDFANVCPSANSTQYTIRTEFQNCSDPSDPLLRVDIVNVTKSTSVTALTVTPVNATCGNNNGSVTIGAVTGGAAPYTYSFNGSAFTAATSYTGVGAGTYPVIVKDDGGCTFNTSVTVTSTAATAVPVATSPVNYCENDPAVQLTATGTGLLWYAAATGGTPLSAAPTPVTTAAGSTTYYVTQTIGVCESPRLPVVVNVNALTVPAFTAVAPVCTGATLAALPSTSNNGVTGTWSPALNNTAPTTYTFTPAAGQCASTTTLTITVNPVVTPTFAAVAPVCAGTVFSLPAISANGITGTWSPALNNTAPTTYTFTPAAGQCASTATMTVTVTPNVLPVFTAVAPVCAGSALAPLPTTSNNGIAGTWSPALNNNATTTYTFTPAAGSCASAATLIITVNQTPAAPVTSPVTYCTNATALPLAVTGTDVLWYTSATGGTGSATAPTPVTTAAGSTTFFVSQSAGGCESARSAVTVTVTDPVSITLTADTTICQGDTLRLFPVVTPAADTYEWTAAGVFQNTLLNSHIRDAVIVTADSSIYTLKAAINGCVSQAAIRVNVLWKPVVEAGANVAVCTGDSILIKGTVSHISGFADSLAWTPTDSIRPANTVLSNSIQSWAHPASSSWYRLTVYTTVAGYGCAFEANDSLKVVVNKPIAAFAGNDTIAVKGVPHQLYGSGGTYYSWSSPSASISNPLLQNPVAILNNDANFYLTVKDAIGCEGKDTVFVKVYNGPAYYVPGAFSPNGDGLNDVFRVIPVGIANTVYFKVFNRFGQVVFESNKWLKGWDGTFKGKLQPVGTYVWMLKGQDRYGKYIEMKGTVLLIQ